MGETAVKLGLGKHTLNSVPLGRRAFQVTGIPRALLGTMNSPIAQDSEITACPLLLILQVLGS